MKPIKIQYKGKEYLCDYTSYGWSYYVPVIKCKKAKSILGFSFSYQKTYLVKKDYRLQAAVDQYLPKDFYDWYNWVLKGLHEYIAAWEEHQAGEMK